ncbi:hypothetical protein IV203_020574 [Nitzschia inconspicua]|uniref:Uncharacterized protein n=1 Tax=Nitzschia inconspicua TaxID=303405 RepID=A0A9K3KGC8_9STRA|nr:hypothetical protein IV203_020574 [Nitzschia inconspicua]
MTQTPLETFIESLLTTAPRSSGCDDEDENEDDHSLSSYGSVSSDEVSLDVKIVADNAKKPSQSLSDSLSLSASLGSCTDLLDWEQQFTENKGLPSRKSISSQWSLIFDAGGDMGKISSQRFQPTFPEPFVDLRSPPTKRKDTMQLPLTTADRKWEEFRGSDSPDFMLRRPQRKSNNIPQLSVPFPGSLPEAPDLKQTQRKRSNLATQTTEKDFEILSHLEQAASISNSPFVDGHSTNLHYDADWNLNLSLHNKFRSRNRERPLRAAKSMPSLSWLPPRLVTPVLQDSRPHSV